MPSTHTALCLLTFTLAIATLIARTSGHGRLIEPPSRASAWRYGFATPPNYNDHELYCGGYQRQWSKNGGKCGECGDAYDLPVPRPNEFGGAFGQGVVVRKYNPGASMLIRVELTASHMGYFEFRVCPEPGGKQDCLDKYLLKLISGTPSIQNPSDLETRFYPRNGSRIYEIKAQLPEGLKCDICMLQWRYVAGNNWGNCEDGTGAVGCGPQEEFRACADVSIGTGNFTTTTIRVPRPGKTTTPSTKTVTETVSTEAPQDGVPAGVEAEGDHFFLGWFIVLIALLVVLCVLAAVYLYHYHGQRVKQVLRWKRNQRNNAAANAAAAQETTSAVASSAASTGGMSSAGVGGDVEANTAGVGPSSVMLVVPPPVPPPRTKRLPQVREIRADESSVLNGSGVESGSTPRS